MATARLRRAGRSPSARKTGAKKPVRKKAAATKAAAKKAGQKRAAKALTSRRAIVNMRVPAAVLDRIDRAAEVSASSRTEFMVRAAETAAANLLLDQTEFRLSAEAHDAFLAAIDAPADPSPELIKLLQTPAPWDR